MESLEQVGFDSDGSSVIFDNSENAHIFSEKYIFTDKKKTIIYNGVANICGKDLITKRIDTVSWTWTDDEGNCTKINLIIYPTFHTHQSIY